MSFAKADTLIELATLTASRRHGITLDDVTERFAVSHRTAQRMLHQMELTFPDAETRFDDEGRKRWTLATAALRDLMTLTPDELAALDHAANALARDGQTPEAEALTRLRDKILALVPRDRARRARTDHEALLEAQGFVARPGPRPRADAGIAEVLSEAIKACRVVEIVYSPRNRPRTTSKVMPYGLLAGMRRYLVVMAAGRTEPSLRAIDRIVEARLTDESFVRDPAFDLAAFAKRSFGAFQSPQEYGEIIWRFTPAAADTARDFVFHPDQVLTTDDDGSLTVRFAAAGYLEMAWHLYMWGDTVEVLAPRGPASPGGSASPQRLASHAVARQPRRLALDSAPVNLFISDWEAAPSGAAVNGALWAIGDVHGHLEHLKALIGGIATSQKSDPQQIVMLGDLCRSRRPVDRDARLSRRARQPGHLPARQSRRLSRLVPS